MAENQEEIKNKKRYTYQGVPQKDVPLVDPTITQGGSNVLQKLTYPAVATRKYIVNPLINQTTQDEAKKYTENKDFYQEPTIAQTVKKKVSEITSTDRELNQAFRDWEIKKGRKITLEEAQIWSEDREGETGIYPEIYFKTPPESDVAVAAGHAADFVLDPLNLIPGAVVGKAIKGVGKVAGAVGKTAKKVFSADSAFPTSKELLEKQAKELLEKGTDPKALDEARNVRATLSQGTEGKSIPLSKQTKEYQPNPKVEILRAQIKASDGTLNASKQRLKSLDQKRQSSEGELNQALTNHNNLKTTLRGSQQKHKTLERQVQDATNDFNKAKNEENKLKTLFKENPKDTGTLSQLRQAEKNSQGLKDREIALKRQMQDAKKEAWARDKQTKESQERIAELQKKMQADRNEYVKYEKDLGKKRIKNANDQVKLAELEAKDQLRLKQAQEADQGVPTDLQEVYSTSKSSSQRPTQQVTPSQHAEVVEQLTGQKVRPEGFTARLLNKAEDLYHRGLIGDDAMLKMRFGFFDNSLRNKGQKTFTQTVNDLRGFKKTQIDELRAQGVPENQIQQLTNKQYPEFYKGMVDKSKARPPVIGDPPVGGGKRAWYNYLDNAETVLGRRNEDIIKAANQLDQTRIAPSSIFAKTTRHIDAFRKTGNTTRDPKAIRAVKNMLTEYSNAVAKGPMSLEDLYSLRKSVNKNFSDANFSLKGGTASSAEKELLEAMLIDINSAIKTRLYSIQKANPNSKVYSNFISNNSSFQTVKESKKYFGSQIESSTGAATTAATAGQLAGGGWQTGLGRIAIEAGDLLGRGLEGVSKAKQIITKPYNPITTRSVLQKATGGRDKVETSD